MDRPRRRLTFLCLILASCVATARADTVWVRSGDKGGALPYQNVRVNGIKDGELLYTVAASGRQATRDLASVVRIQLDSDPVFSAAEEAFEQGDFKKAAAGYQRVAGSSAPAWVKDRASLRLIDAAAESGDFAAAVTGYLAVLAKSPELARQVRPQIPQKNPQQAAAVIGEVEKGANNARLGAEQRQQLDLFLVDLYRAANQTEKAAALVDRLIKSGALAADDPESMRMQAGLKLRAAALALEQKEFAKVIKEIDSGRALFNDRQQQADALFYRAEALAGMAKDEKSLADAALAYMRVVAHFKNDPAKPRVAESLLKTAALQEKLNAPEEALALYEQAAQEFKGTPVAEQAQQGAARVKPLVEKAK